MKVLHVAKAHGIGGAERHLIALLPALANEGIAVRMCIVAAGHYERLAEPLRHRGVPVTVVPAGPDLNPLLCARLVAEARAFRPTIVHTHLIHADVHGQLAARTLRLRTVSSVHGTHDFYRRMPYRAAATLAGHLSSRTVAISEYVAQFLTELRLAPPRRIRVVPYGLDPEGWQIDSGARADARREFGLADDDIAVGVASRLVEDKGHAFLIEAAERARRELPKLRILIAGEGPLRPELELRARSLPDGSVTFLGFLPDVRRFMNACDVFAFPTLPRFGEGFGLAALEAMAAGRAVVATNTGPLPEVVADGVTGVVVTPGALDQLSDALVSLGRDPGLRERLGAQGRERAVSHFSFTCMVNRTVDVYKELLEHHPPIV